jgi:short-subunit dehydrogenase
LIGTINTPFTDVNVSDLRANFEVNTVGFLVLYKAFSSLLAAAPKPKLIAISSFAGQIAEKKEGIEVGYGTSKAALNYIVTKIDQQDPELIAFAIQ